jgi:hypothetical protein
MKDGSLSLDTRSSSAIVGSFLVALSYAVAGFATYAILSDISDLHTRAGDTCWLELWP